MNKWIRVSKLNPCPICKRPDWCSISEDGDTVWCMRVESDGEQQNKNIHKIGEETEYKRPIMRPQPPEQPKLTSQQLKEIWKGYARTTESDSLDWIAGKLGVSRASLISLHAVKRDGFSWIFPMWNPNGSMVGLRIRTNSGDKFAWKGSRQGLSIPDYVDPDDTEPLIICEGPTDTAAAITMGFHAIGRPSCTGGETMIREFLYRRRAVTIIADRDTPKERPDGSTWLPGQQGAEKLAEAICDLCSTLKIIKPNAFSVKDIRAWLVAGATKPIVEAAIRQGFQWKGLTNE